MVIEKITGMTFRIDRILGDRPFAEAGDPVLAVTDERRGLLAVAGAHEFGGPAPVGVYRTDDLACRALFRSRHPVHAMAFHPTLPLLVVGTGRYDGGYFFGAVPGNPLPDAGQSASRAARAARAARAVPVRRPRPVRSARFSPVQSWSASAA